MPTVNCTILRANIFSYVETSRKYLKVKKFTGFHKNMGCWKQNFRFNPIESWQNMQWLQNSAVQVTSSYCPDYRPLAHEGCGGEGLYPQLLPRPLQQQQLCQQQQHHGPLHGHNHKQCPTLQPSLLTSPHRTQLKAILYSSCEKSAEYNSGFLLVGALSRLSIGRRIVQASFLYKKVQAPSSLWKKPFCFSFLSENSFIKDRQSRCQYLDIFPATATQLKKVHYSSSQSLVSYWSANCPGLTDKKENQIFPHI